MDKEELKQILFDHKLWMNTGNIKGKQAYLRKAYLVGVHLRGVHLVGADLVEADLVGADLGGANLKKADLGGANLGGADLAGANLRQANLRQTNLVGADLGVAHLVEADLRGANLRQANLKKANLKKALIDKIALENLRYPLSKEQLSMIRVIDDDYVEERESKEDEENIKRSIVFDKEYYSSGMTILNNFSRIIRDKYPDKKIKVTILQEDLKVSMTIQHPEGDKELFEEELEKYGMVVRGEMRPEEFVDNPHQLTMLKSELNIAIAQQNNTLMLLELEKRHGEDMKKQYESRISSLEEQMREFFVSPKRLLEYQDKTLTSHKETLDKLLEILKNTPLEGISENDDPDEITNKVEKFKRKDSKGFNDFLTRVSSGFFVRMLPEWIQALIEGRR